MRRWRHWTAWTVLGPLFLLLTGCGAQAPRDGGAAAPAGAQTAAPAAGGGKRVFITVGYQAPTAQTWGALIMKHQKLFEKHLRAADPQAEFTVDWYNSPSGPPLNNGMVAGKIQLAFMGDMPLLANGAQGQSQPNYTSVFLAFDGKGAAGKNQSVMIPRGSGLQMPDLKGKTVSVPLGSSAHRMLLAALEKHNLQGQVEIVDHSVTVGLQSVEQKKITAHATWEPYPSLMLHTGSGEVLLDGSETGIDYLDGVVAHRQWVESNPAYAVAFLKGLIEAHQFIRSAPEEAARIFAAESGFPLEVCQKMARAIRFDAAIYDRDMRTLAGSRDFLIGLGKMKALNLEQFKDDRYLRQAAAELGLSYPTPQELAGDWLPDRVY